MRRWSAELRSIAPTARDAGRAVARMKGGAEEVVSAKCRRPVASRSVKRACVSEGGSERVGVESCGRLASMADRGLLERTDDAGRIYIDDDIFIYMRLACCELQYIVQQYRQ